MDANNDNKEKKKINEDLVVFMRKRSDTEAPRYTARLKTYVDFQQKRRRAAAARRHLECQCSPGTAARKKEEQKDKTSENRSIAIDPQSQQVPWSYEDSSSVKLVYRGRATGSRADTPNRTFRSNCGIIGNESPGSEDGHVNRRKENAGSEDRHESRRRPGNSDGEKTPRNRSFSCSNSELSDRCCRRKRKGGRRGGCCRRRRRRRSCGKRRRGRRSCGRRRRRRGSASRRRRRSCGRKRRRRRRRC